MTRSTTLTKRAAQAATLDEKLAFIAEETWRRAIEQGKWKGDPKDAPIPNEAVIVEWLPNCPPKWLEESHGEVVKSAGKPVSLMFAFDKLPDRVTTRPLTQDELNDLRPAMLGLLKPDEPVDAADAVKSLVDLKGKLKQELGDMPTETVTIELKPTSAKEMAVDQLGGAVEWVWLPELAKSDNADMREWAKVRKMVPVAIRDGRMARPATDWLQWPDAERALVPLVRAWQAAQVARTNAFTPVKAASVPRLHVVSVEDAKEAMTMPLPWREEPAQLTMPGMPEPIEGYPSWLLSAYESLVGDINGRTSYELRLFVAALLRIARADRDGQWHTIVFPVLEKHRERYGAKESIESLMFEDGWTNFERDWPTLLTALKNLNRSPASRLVKHEINTSFEFFHVSADPQAEDGLVEFSIRIPPSAANGDRIDWPSLRRYGLKSRARYCAYLSAAALIGQTAHHGHPQTMQIGKPLLDDNGKERRGKGGRLIRSKDDMVANERARRLVRGYTSYDLARFAAMKPTRGMDRTRAVGHFEALAEDGHIDLQRDGSNWRIFGAPKPI